MEERGLTSESPGGTGLQPVLDGCPDVDPLGRQPEKFKPVSSSGESVPKCLEEGKDRKDDVEGVDLESRTCGCEGSVAGETRRRVSACSPVDRYT